MSLAAQVRNPVKVFHQLCTLAGGQQHSGNPELFHTLRFLRDLVECPDHRQKLENAIDWLVLDDVGVWYAKHLESIGNLELLEKELRDLWRLQWYRNRYAFRLAGLMDWHTEIEDRVRSQHRRRIAAEIVRLAAAM